MRVTKLGLGPAALACLCAADITDVDQLVRYTGDELIEKGIDGAELYEIVRALNERSRSLPSMPGLKFRRPPTERERTMLRLRLIQGLTLDEIGEQTGVSRDRVRQLLRQCFGVTGEPKAVVARKKAKVQKRRAANLARAQVHTAELLARWRKGATTTHLADAFDLSWRSVEEVIQTTATDADRAARAKARRRGRPPRWR